jgi:hypothetical protein
MDLDNFIIGKTQERRAKGRVVKKTATVATWLEDHCRSTSIKNATI